MMADDILFDLLHSEIVNYTFGIKDKKEKKVVIYMIRNFYTMFNFP